MTRLSLVSFLAAALLLSACGAGSAPNANEIFDEYAPEQIESMLSNDEIENTKVDLEESSVSRGVEDMVESVLAKNVEIRVYRTNPAKGPGLVELEHVDVFVNGERVYTWLTSTACNCSKTPTKGLPFVAVTRPGNYKIWTTSRYHLSSEFGGSKMHFAMFFDGGRAIHATYGEDHLSQLGHPASAGCVRLAEANAQALWNLVMKYGVANARVVVSDLQDKTFMYPLSKTPAPGPADSARGK